MAKGMFICNGKINIYDWQLNAMSFLLQKDLDYLLHGKKITLESSTIKIFNCELTGINVLLNIKHFTRCMESKLKLLTRHEKPAIFGQEMMNDREIDYATTRTMISEFVFHLRTILLSLKEDSLDLTDIADDAEKDFDELIKTICRFLKQLHNIQDSTFLYVASNSNTPEYHLYHVHLDLQWLLLTLVYTKHSFCKYLDNNIDNLENAIFSAIGDLMYVAMKIFATIEAKDYQFRTPYSCTCVRELWIMIQILTDQLHANVNSKIFWIYVKLFLNQLFPNESTVESNSLNIHIQLKDCKKPELFSIWLIYHLTMLYGYSESGNYCNGPSNRFKDLQMESSFDQCEKVVKVFIIKGGKDGGRDEVDEELCGIIPLLHELSFNWWKPKTQIISLLWECFHKRLDKPFLLQTRGPWSTSSEKKTPMDILNHSRDRLKKDVDITTESSFGLFLKFLGSFLQKYYDQNDLKFWNQIKGRIYSRFSQNKIQDFSECGLYNYISLFITLAITADTSNVCSTLLSLLPPVLEWADSTGGKKCLLTWKSRLVVLILYHEKNLSLKDIAESYTETVNAISCRSDEFSHSMLMWFIDILRIILIKSEDFGLHEHLLLDGWIDRYLKDSAPNKVGVLTSTLLKVFQKCNELHTTNPIGCTAMLNALWSHVASRIRQTVTICDLSTDFYVNSTKLAVAFTIEACRDPVTAKKYRHSHVTLFQHFTTSVIIKDIRITRLYLASILQNTTALENLKSDISNFNIICIQAWVKCNILNVEINDETNFLKNFIIGLPELNEIFSSQDKIEFLNCDESIVLFFMVISKKRNSFESDQMCQPYDSLCKSFIHNIEKWALQLISEENKDDKLSFWIYQCLGTILLCCSPILYAKNQPNNSLRMLINKIALPTEQSAYLMNLAKRIFSMIILGFENLNIKSDITLQTLLRDLFDRYLPLLITRDDNTLKVSDTLLKCFKDVNCNFIKSLLDILNCNFIIISKDRATHKHCQLVMSLLKSILVKGKIYTKDTVDAIITICVQSIHNCYMRVQQDHPHKKDTLDFVKYLSSNPYFIEDLNLREKFNEIVWNVVNRYIQTNSTSSFDYVQFIHRYNLELFNFLSVRIEKIVLECEKYMRPNAASLRFSFNNTKRSLDRLQSKNNT
ncbi:hypothetical protein TKK_0012396 [Trichogramma kaykai]|uniref:Protein MMS22-like n=1 Tax=Trichogramma kaykai TaxID=54128 RepID=A0ABD2WPW7_9HYME